MMITRRMGRAAFLLVGFLSLGKALVGCGVGRRGVPPVTDLPPAFSGTGATESVGAWWIALGDSALSATSEEALGGSPDLAIWWDRLDQTWGASRAEIEILKR